MDSDIEFKDDAEVRECLAKPGMAIELEQMALPRLQFTADGAHVFTSYEITKAANDKWKHLISHYSKLSTLQNEQHQILDKVIHLLGHYQEAVVFSHKR